MAAAGPGWDKGWHKQKIASWQKYSWFDKIMEILLMHRLKHAAAVKIMFPELSILVTVVGKFGDDEKHQQYAVGEREHFSKLYPASAAASHAGTCSPVCPRAPRGQALGHSGQGARCWVRAGPGPPLHRSLQPYVGASWHSDSWQRAEPQPSMSGGPGQLTRAASPVCTCC